MTLKAARRDIKIDQDWRFIEYNSNIFAFLWYNHVVSTLADHTITVSLE